MRIHCPASRVIGMTLGGLPAASLLFMLGCASVPPAQVATFGQGVDAAKLQLDTTFASVNQIATEDEIDRAITLPTLNEEDVGNVLKREDIAKWDQAFAEIDDYVANLTLLISPDRANDFSSATESLATSLAKLDPQALPSSGVATAFAELGRLLIEAKAETDALHAARTADPGIQAIFSAMAQAIGDTNQQGIRGTVWSHWILRMAVQRVAFLDASGDARRASVLVFIDLRDKRDAQDLQLGSLRQSLLDLAVAHAALARGANFELDAAIGRVQQELDATRALDEHFKSLTPKVGDQ
jgi:hypothetical protein